MDTTLFLSQIFGLIMLVGGMGMWRERKLAMEAITNFGKNKTMVFLTGFPALVVGLLIVLSHNDWTQGPALVVTLIGWLAILKGLLRIFAPEWSANLIRSFGKANWYNTAMVIVLALGIYLTYVGFLA